MGEDLDGLAGAAVGLAVGSCEVVVAVNFLCLRGRVSGGWLDWAGVAYAAGDGLEECAAGLDHLEHRAGNVDFAVCRLDVEDGVVCADGHGHCEVVALLGLDGGCESQDGN